MSPPGTSLSAPSLPDGSEPGVSVVVPTYKEVENLEPLVTRISAALRAAGLPYEIVVVDDDSQDGTEALCARLAAEHPVQLLVRRGRRGLATAVLEGLALARRDVLVVLDADLSHPPELIPELCAALSNPAVDMVLGSRYVKGGGTGEGWTVLRWLNSVGATLLARPITSARDPMSGFFGMHRAKFLASARPEPLGYKIALELIVKARCRHVAEVPIHFVVRERGESKLSLSVQVQYLRQLGRLYLHRLGDARPASLFLASALACLALSLGATALFASSLPGGARPAVVAGLSGLACLAVPWLLAKAAPWSYVASRPRGPWTLACVVGALAGWGGWALAASTFPG